MSHELIIHVVQPLMFLATLVGLALTFVAFIKYRAIRSRTRPLVSRFTLIGHPREFYVFLSIGMITAILANILVRLN
jgi:hypothetical protein